MATSLSPTSAHRAPAYLLRGELIEGAKQTAHPG